VALGEHGDGRVLPTKIFVEGQRLQYLASEKQLIGLFSFRVEVSFVMHGRLGWCRRLCVKK